MKTNTTASREAVEIGSSGDPELSTLVLGDGGTHEIERLPSFICGGEPDTIVDWGIVGGLTVRAASVRGRSHRFENNLRQDSFGLGRAETQDAGCLIVTVADGVGDPNLSLSHRAAEVAVRLATEYTRESIEQGNPPESVEWDAIIDRIREELLDLSKAETGNPDLDYRSVAKGVLATTLLVVTIGLKQGDGGERDCTVVPLGDTSAWILRNDSWMSITPIKGEGSAVAESSVPALPMRYDRSIRPLTCQLLPGDACFCFSDGVGDPVVDGTGLVGNRLSEIWQRPPNPYLFANQTDFARRGHLDDRTAIGIWVPTENIVSNYEHDG